MQKVCVAWLDIMAGLDGTDGLLVAWFRRLGQLAEYAGLRSLIIGDPCLALFEIANLSFI